MKRSTTKRGHERAVRTTISMAPLLFDAGTHKQRAVGFTTFSDYVQSLIRADAFTQQPAAK